MSRGEDNGPCPELLPSSSFLHGSDPIRGPTDWCPRTTDLGLGAWKQTPDPSLAPVPWEAQQVARVWEESKDAALWWEGALPDTRFCHLSSALAGAWHADLSPEFCPCWGLGEMLQGQDTEFISILMNYFWSKNRDSWLMLALKLNSSVSLISWGPFPITIFLSWEGPCSCQGRDTDVSVGKGAPSPAVTCASCPGPGRNQIFLQDTGDRKACRSDPPHSLDRAMELAVALFLLHPRIHPSIHLLTYPTTHPFTHLSIQLPPTELSNLSTHPSTHPLTHPSIHSRVHSSIHPPSYPSAQSFIYLSTHPDG